MKEQRLGEFQTVPNTALRHPELEADELIVGYVEVNDETAVLAFTKNELARPAERATKNIEDLPLLRPSVEVVMKHLAEDHNALLDRYRSLCARGFFARLFNWGCKS